MTGVPRLVPPTVLALALAAAAAAAEDPPVPPAPPPVTAPAAAVEGSAEKVALRLRVKKDEVRRMQASTRQTIRQTIAGQEQVTEQDMRCGLIYRILETAEDGSFVVETTYDSVAMKMSMMGMVVDYDSAKSPEDVPEMARPMAALLGKKLRIRMDVRGGITAVEGIRELIDGMIEDSAGDDPAQKEMMRSMMEQALPEEAFKDMLSQNLTRLPEEPVGVGGSWKWKVDMKKPFPMVLEGTMTLRERREGRCRVDLEGTLASQEGGGLMEMGPMKMRFHLKGKQKGTVVIDEATGWTTETRIDQEFSGKMDLETEEAEGMSIPMSCTQVITVTCE